MSSGHCNGLAKRNAIAILLLLCLMIPAPGYAGAQKNAQCGAANTQAYWPSAPTELSDLCRVGTPSLVRGNGPWTWFCSGPRRLQATCFAAPAAVKIYALRAAKVNLTSIRQLITKARTIFSRTSTQNTTVVLKIPAGAFDLSKDSNGQTIYCDPPGGCGGVRAIEFGSLTPGPKGRFILLGAGPDQTEFVVSPDQVQFVGHNDERVTVAGIKLSADRLEASQGIEVSAGVATPDGTPNWVGIDIESGFPLMLRYPRGLWNPAKHGNRGKGQFLRRYLAGSPCNIDTTLHQFHYDKVVPDSRIPNRWWFGLNVANPFGSDGGDLIGIKSKAGAGQAYIFSHSNDIIFHDVLWMRTSRGVFRRGTISVQIYDSQILPDQAVDGQAVCMVSSGGGPQIGQPNDSPTWGNVIDNLYAMNTGDDSIAAFNAYDGNGAVGISISNSHIANSFARTVYLYHTPYEVPDGIDSFTEQNLVNCNSALPLTSPPSEPSLARTESDIGFSECVLYRPIGQ